MLGAYLAIKSFLKDKKNIHVQLLMDNMVALNCLRKMGSSKSQKLNNLTKEIWGWCIKQGIWISTAYIPGIENVEADEESRKVNLDSEWMLNTPLLSQSLNMLRFEPDIDLFASRINHQFERYVSFRPDPNAFAIDA